MGEEADYYQALGLKPSATAAEIKTAYHTQAKAAHPDAGGSVEAMARVNAAYETLHDPVKRADYDAAHRHRRAGDTSSARTAGFAATSSHATPQEEDHAEQAYREEAAHIHRQRHRWARSSAWQLARLTAPSTIVGVALWQFVAATSTNPSLRRAAAFIAFLPIYGLAISIAFLMNPPLRLVFADLWRRYKTTREEQAGGLAIILAFFPLAILWMALFA